MEEINPIEAEFNVKELEGELVNISLGELEEVEGGFQKEGFNAPDASSFDGGAGRAVFDGFTKGALKNIITLSREKIRLYKVTKDSIELLSCSEQPNVARSTFVLNQQTCSIQAFPYQENMSTILRFDPETGELLERREIEFFRTQKIKDVKPIETGAKTSIKPKFLSAVVDPTPANLWLNHIHMVERLWKGKLQMWISLERILKNRSEKTIAHYKSQVQQMRQEIQQNFTSFSKSLITKTFVYDNANPSLVLAVSKNQVALTFTLINLRLKKVVKSSSMNLIEILGGTKVVEELLADEMQGDPEGGLNHFAFKIRRCAFVPSSHSMLLTAEIKNLELIVKIDDVFNSDVANHVRFVKRKKLSYGISLLKGYGSDRVLSSYSDSPSTTDARSLAWIDPDTLEETKLEKFHEGGGRGSLLSNTHNFTSDSSITPLTDNLMLILNQFSFMVFDFNQDKVIASLNYLYIRFEPSKFRKINNLYAKGYSYCLNLMRTKKAQETGEEVVDTIKTIYFADLIPNLILKFSASTYYFFKLKNGNYLYVGKKYFGVEDEQNGDKRLRLVSLEIDGNTLEVLETNITDFPEGEIQLQNSQTMCIVGDFLIFNAKVRRFEGKEVQTPGDTTSLVLASTDLKVLDYSRRSIPEGWSSDSIKAASSNRIVSLGINNRFYLHEVNFETKKLVLLKTMALGDAKAAFNPLGLIPRTSFILFVKPSDSGTEMVFLRFDMNLGLTSHLKVRGIRRTSCLYPLRGERVAFFDTSLQKVFVLDLNSAEAKLGDRMSSYRDALDYALDGESGRVVSLDLSFESLEKVFLD